MPGSLAPSISPRPPPVLPQTPRCHRLVSHLCIYTFVSIAFAFIERKAMIVGREGEEGGDEESGEGFGPSGGGGERRRTGELR